MTDLPERGRPYAPASRGSLLTRMFMNSRVQAAVARTPLLGRIARAEGEAMFGLVGGFVNSQILLALVELKVLDALVSGPLAAPGPRQSLPPPFGLDLDRLTN